MDHNPLAQWQLALLAQKRFDFGPSSFGGELQIIPVEFHDEVLKSLCPQLLDSPQQQPNSFVIDKLPEKAKSIALTRLPPGAWPWL